MTRRSKKTIVFIIISVVLASSIYSYLVWNKPHKDIKDASAEATTAINLYHLFATDSLEAKSEFLNRVVKVSGIVKGVSMNADKKIIVLFETSVSGASVNCTMEEPGLNAKPGDSISLKGLCVGYIGGDESMGLPGDVYVVRCYRAI